MKEILSKNNISQVQIDITTNIEETNRGNISKANIILTNHKFIQNDESNYDKIIGQVKNVGNGVAEWVKVTFTFYDNNNSIVATDRTYTDPKKLNPDQKAPFSKMVNKGEIGLATKYELSLSWDNPDGSEEYIEDVDVTKDPQEKIPIIENTTQNPQEKTPIIENTKQTNNENENFPFFNTDGNNIEKLGNEENKEDEDEDEDSDDKDNN